MSHLRLANDPARVYLSKLPCVVRHLPRQLRVLSSSGVCSSQLRTRCRDNHPQLLLILLSVWGDILRVILLMMLRIMFELHRQVR